MRILIAALIFFSLLASSRMTSAQNTGALAIKEKQFLFVRELQQSLNELQEKIQHRDLAQQQSLRKSLASELLGKFDATLIDSNSPTSDFLLYYRAYLQAVAGQTPQARARLLPLLESETIAPEVMEILLEIDDGVSQLDDEGFRKRLGYWKSLARVIPVSAYGGFSDSQETQETRIVEDQPLIPFVNSGRTDSNLVRVAQLFFEMTLNGKAEVGYVEAIYASFPPVANTRVWYWEAWLSSVTAPLWLRAAEAESKSRCREKVITDYIAKAIVFGSESTKDAALKVLQEWRENGIPETPPPAEPDAEKLKQIARLYAQMNMHPRAIEIMKEFAPVIGPEAATLQGQYEQEWLKLVAQYCVGTMPGQCVLFGQDVSQPENRLKVQIPPPLRPEALEQAAKAVRTLNSEMPKQETNPTP